MNVIDVTSVIHFADNSGGSLLSTRLIGERKRDQDDIYIGFIESDPFFLVLFPV
jgi:hypothetical protein